MSITTVIGRCVAVNSMLMLMEYGCKNLGPANPHHHERLERYLKLARKRKSRVAEAERDLRLASQLYGLDQTIVLHEEARSS